MSDPEPSNTPNRSGGADLSSQGDTTIGADVVGRDKIESAGGHIIHAEAGSTVNVEGKVATTPIKLPWRVLGGIALIAAILIGIAALVLRSGQTNIPPQRSCDEAPADYDFESGSNEGWNVKYEGDRKLGLDAKPESVQHCGSGEYSLAFSFAQASEKPTAQINLQTANLRLNDKLSAWIFTPRDAPPDVQASCFILEDNTHHRWSNKPDWPWYQTSNRPLEPGKWTLVECPTKDFVAQYSAVGHWDEPLLVGIEFTCVSGKPFAGTLYLDKIIVR